MLPRTLAALLRCVAALLAVAGLLRAERLPIQIYTPTDGLAQSTVHRIHRDRRGFLWFGTSEGLSRYDGYEFVTYRDRSRPTQPRIRAILDTSDGAVWTGGDSGLCRVNPSTDPAPIYECPEPPSGRVAIRTLFEESPGVLLAGADTGLYRVHLVPQPRFTAVPLAGPTASPIVRDIVPDRSGALWIASTNGIHRLKTGTSTFHLSTRDGLPSDEVLALEFDAGGILWAATVQGLCQIGTNGNNPSIQRVFTANDGLPATTVKTVHIGMQDTLWVGTTSGIAMPVRDPQGQITGFRAYSRSRGLSDIDIDTMEDDRAGNLWIGSQSGGAMKLSRDGFVSYGLADGLGSPYVMAMLETRAGQICAMTRVPGAFHLNFLEGERFRSVPVPVPPSFYSSTWSGWYQVAAETPAGDWWFASERGLLVFPPNWYRAPGPPTAIFDARNGLLTGHIYQIFQDSQGGIWVGTRYEATGIARWDPKTRRFRQFSSADGLPSVENARPNGFGEDAHGQIWIGWWRTGVLRYARGRFQFFGVDDGVPPGGIRRVHTDRKGRVWIGSGRGGVARIDNPTAERPTFRTYGPNDGLSAAEIQAITEDRQGRIYLGHGIGVDRIDPDVPGPLRVRRFTTHDGLAGGELQTALRDRNGVLWFGSVQGVSRLVPQPDRPLPAPQVYFTSVRVNGRVQPIAGGAAQSLSLPPLYAPRDQLQIEYAAPRFAPGETIQYQYRLSPDAPWSPPTTQRSLQLAELPAGAHRLELRATTGDGIASPDNAVLAFEATGPFWRRWWFLLLCAAVIATLGWLLHSFELRRRLEVQAIRMRIARDLHDQVGTGLSQIAILSEVAQRSADPQPLAQIAEVSRELVDSISDIVWAINPARDNLPDLAQRMRRFAADLLTARGIDVKFQAEGLDEADAIGPEARRQIFLIYRESLRNALRHSHCRCVHVRIAKQDRTLIMEVADDGIGFDRAGSHNGTGLASLEDRARSLGGHIEWRNGAGTTLHLRIPLPV